MKMGKWELVTGCGRELWLNPPPLTLAPPSQPRRDEAFGYDSESLTSNRQQDMISYFPEPRWHKFSSPLIIFSCLQWEEKLRRKKKKEGETRPGRSSPRCSCGSFAFNSNNLRIVFMTEDKDVPLVRTLFDWKKSLTPERLQIKPEEHDCMCMQLYLSISAWM